MIQKKYKMSKSQMWQVMREEMAGQNHAEMSLEVPLRILDDKYLVLHTFSVLQRTRVQCSQDWKVYNKMPVDTPPKNVEWIVPLSLMPARALLSVVIIVCCFRY